jgi:hypothetical protein
MNVWVLQDDGYVWGVFRGRASAERTANDVLTERWSDDWHIESSDSDEPILIRHTESGARFTILEMDLL